MRRIILGCVLTLSSFAAAHAATVDGTWKINGSIAGNTLVATCVLTETAGKLSGTCTGTDGKMIPASGTLSGTTIMWSYITTYDGGDITLNYTGKLDSVDHITGTVLVDPYSASGDFTAARDAVVPAKRP